MAEELDPAAEAFLADYEAAWERKQARKRRRRQAQKGKRRTVRVDGQKTHGTRGGFSMHQQRKTDPCVWCRNADNDYQRIRNWRGKCAPGLGWPLLTGKEAGNG